MKRGMMFISLLLLVYLLPANTFGDEGKYQAIVTGEDRDRVLILDTDKGHMWTLSNNECTIVYKGQLSTKLEIGKRYGLRALRDGLEIK